MSTRFNQWSGINSLAYYLPYSFENNIGLSTQLSLIIAGVLGVQYFILSWMYVSFDYSIFHRTSADCQNRPYFFIEKVGRRTAMSWSAAGCSFCMVMIAVMLYVNTLAVCIPPIRVLQFSV